MATAIPMNQAAFDVATIARVTGGEVRGDAETVCRGVVIDSRQVAGGDLFVAVRGERTDGHVYLGQVQAAGAAAALVQRDTPVPEGLALVVVDDTTRALGQLARHHRERWGGKVVAITGSAGKTTTKELTAGAFEGLGCRVLKTPGNLNNQFGVPMTLFLLEPTHDVAVLEVGTSGRGEIAYLADLVRPDVAAVVLVAAAHTEGLGSVEAVAEEKASLWGALGPGGVAVLPADDAMLEGWLARHAPERALRFGRAETADVRLLDRSSTPSGSDLTLQVEGGNVSAHLRLLGEPAAVDACCALACVLALKGPAAVPDALQSMTSVAPTPGRLMPRPAREGYWVIDDSYNANPKSMAFGLSTLMELSRSTGGRAFAVLGDMRELGPLSREAHERVGDLSVELGVSVLAGYGAEMSYATAAAVRAAAGRFARHPTRVMQLSSVAELTRAVRGMLRPADVVLVKGSRSMGLDAVADALAGEGQP